MRYTFLRRYIKQIVCKCQKAYYARAEVLIKCKIENGKLKIAVGQTVCKMQIIFARLFLYIEVAFKCMGGCYGVAIILLYSENSYKRKRSALRTPFSYAHKIIKKEGNSCLIKQQFNLAVFQVISCKPLPYASILTLTVIKVKTVILFFVIDSNNIV